MIVADPGIFSLVRQTAPDLKISMSTQANNTNWPSINFWHKLGAKRAVLARELSLTEIIEIRKQVPEAMEIETFVHGAMCMAYSGRCLLSHYMTGRNSNKGDCAQPCRWKFHLVEETRPDEAFSIEEDESGSFIFNSKDLCLINEIPQLLAAGVDSFKIEGRMKSLYYVATVVSAYRQAIDAAFDHPHIKKVDDILYDELTKVSHRRYTTAFFDGQSKASDQNYGTSSYTRNYDFVGVVLDYDETSKRATIEQRNKISRGDEIEIMIPTKGFFTQKVAMIWDDQGQLIEATPHAKMIYTIGVDQPVATMDILRKKTSQNS